MSWNDYTAFATAAQSAGLQFSYTVTESVPVRQSESIKPVGTADEASADDTGGELTLRGFYTLDAARANDLGRYRVVEGKHLSYSGRAAEGRADLARGGRREWFEGRRTRSLWAIPPMPIPRWR